MTSPRQAIIDAIAARLLSIDAGQTVTMADDTNTVYSFENTLTSKRVFELGSADYPSAEPYAVFYHDKSADADDSENGRTLWALDLSFLIIAKQGQTTTARALAQDVMACLFSDKRLGGLTTTMTVRRLGDPQISRLETLVGDLELIVTLYYRTKDWQL